MSFDIVSGSYNLGVKKHYPLGHRLRVVHANPRKDNRVDRASSLIVVTKTVLASFRLVGIFGFKEELEKWPLLFIFLCTQQGYVRGCGCLLPAVFCRPNATLNHSYLPIVL